MTSLSPMGYARGVPLAAIDLESPLLPEPTTGFVNHKLDYQHLTEAFRRNESEPNTEVLIFWTKQHFKLWAKPFAPFMPRMVVMLCPVDAYELVTDQTYKPDLQGLERWEAQRPVAEWKPDVMQ